MIMTYRGCTRDSAYDEASRVYLDGCNNNVLIYQYSQRTSSNKS